MFWGLKCKGEWGSDKGLCLLCSRDEGSFVTVKLDPPPFLGGVNIHEVNSRPARLLRGLVAFWGPFHTTKLIFHVVSGCALSTFFCETFPILEG